MKTPKKWAALASMMLLLPLVLLCCHQPPASSPEAPVSSEQKALVLRVASLEGELSALRHLMQQQGQRAGANRQAVTVDVASLANGDVPQWNSATAIWETNAAGGGGSPGGSTTEIQYRSGASTFGGDAAYILDTTNHRPRSENGFAIHANGTAFDATLACTPTANRTITLQDATGTVVLRDTTDTLTNKTVNATSNTITDTSTANGDVLVSNGTKFVRKAVCTSSQAYLGGSTVTCGQIADAQVASGAAVAVNKLAPGSNGNCLTTTGGAAAWGSCGAGISGTDTQVLFFDGTNNPAGDADFVWDKTNNFLTVTSGYKVGGTPATAGAIRLTNNAFAYQRNTANSANALLIGLNSGDTLVIGDTTNANVSIATQTSQGIYLKSGSTTDLLAESGQTTLSGNLIFNSGTSVATTGTIREKNNTSILCARNAANSANLCALATDGSNRLYVGSDSSFTSQVVTVDVFGSTNVDLGVGSTDYINLTGGNVEVAKPIIGESSASSPFGVHGALDVDVTSSPLTLAASQYKYSYIRATTTQTSGKTMNMPAPSDSNGPDGYWKMVYNGNTTGALTVGMTSSGTTINVAAQKSAILFIHRGIGVIRITPDAANWKPKARDPLKLRRPRVVEAVALPMAA